LEKHHHISIIDFKTTEHQTKFVQFTGYDANQEKKFTAEVKFVGGVPYGDIIHPDRSTLSSECRDFIREQLLHKYNTGQF